MEERANQTVMCSVLFLEIVEYSRKSVTGQISLKDRFNSYLSAAIRDVPITDRIILDTGDGAAINFLGDVEDALKAALSLRESLRNEDPDSDHPLRVRMGINLGPVRMVRDINGQPNIVGDGINVAQRVMSFADVSQILVSRSYYDAVSRLSSQYVGMFRYQGSRTDKHVREHEVYAIGYPGDKTTQRGAIKPVSSLGAASPLAGIIERAKVLWHSSATKTDVLIGQLLISFRQAGPQQRAVYIGAAALVALLLIVMVASQLHRKDAGMTTDSIEQQSAGSSQPASAVTPVPPVHTVAEGSKARASTASKHKPKPKYPAAQPGTKTQEAYAKKPADAGANGSAKAYISVSCREGTEVFVDGVRKGRIGSLPLSVVIPPGKHTVIVSHPRAGVFSQDVVLGAGKTVRLNPGFCNQ